MSFIELASSPEQFQNGSTSASASAQGIARRSLYCYRRPPRILHRHGNAISPECHAGLPCPTTGIWYPEPDEDHPEASVIDSCWRQRYIHAGVLLPDATVGDCRPPADSFGASAKQTRT